MDYKKISGLFAFILIATGVTYVAIQPKHDCVNVYVDFGVLNNNSKVEVCAPVNGKTNALDIMKKAKINLEGTDKYGLKVVCRVEGLPSAVAPIGIKGHEQYVETCSSMPAEFGYWALLVKNRKTVFNMFDPSSRWQWAKTGISDVYLNKGDTIGLVFSENGKTNFPK